MKKRNIILLLIFVMAFSLMACNGSDNNEKKDEKAQ